MKDILDALFTHVKDAKSLLLYTITLFIALIAFLIIQNQGELISFAKNFSKNTVIEQVSARRVADYPRVSKSVANTLYMQVRSDAVIIAEYKPRFINNSQDLIAWEGSLHINPIDALDAVVDQSSDMYQAHLRGQNFEYVFADDVEIKWGDSVFVTNGMEYEKMGVEYIYTCPIFNLDNFYSGYVGIVYSEPPYHSPEEHQNLVEYLGRVCPIQARELGRKK